MRQGEIERLLPGVFRRTLRSGGPLSTLLEVMELLHRPSEEILEKVQTTFMPYRAPDRFVPYLARWVDLGRFFQGPTSNQPEANESLSRLSIGPGNLRELIAAAAYLSQWRGTSRGLLLFLETATGVQGFEIDEQVPDAEGLPRPFHILVRAPGSTETHRALIERIVDQEKPAYVTYELEFVREGQG